MLHSRFRSLLAVLLVLALGACSRGVTGDLATLNRAVPIENAQTASVHIRMGAGQLVVTGGAQDLMNADFTYNVAVWEPEVSYTVNGTQGMLTVSQPADIQLDQDIANLRYDWDISLNNSVPLALDVELGAGKSNLNLAQLNLTDLQIATGAGSVDLNLGGNWDYDWQADIRGGVGNLDLTVPSQMGVRVSVSGGLGNIVATGMHRDGDAFVNDAYGTAANTLVVNVEGGLGDVNISVAE